MSGVVDIHSDEYIIGQNTENIVNRKAGHKKISAMLWTLTAPIFLELKTVNVV